MFINNYLNVVQDLNERICELPAYENGEIYFAFETTGYAEIITFMGMTVYSSENDCEIESEEELSKFIISKVKEIICQLQILI